MRAPTEVGFTSSTVTVIDSLLLAYRADLVPCKTQDGKLTVLYILEPNLDDKTAVFLEFQISNLRNQQLAQAEGEGKR